MSTNAHAGLLVLVAALPLRHRRRPGRARRQCRRDDDAALEVCRAGHLRSPARRSRSAGRGRGQQRVGDASGSSSSSDPVDPAGAARPPRATPSTVRTCGDGAHRSDAPTGQRGRTREIVDAKTDHAPAMGLTGGRAAAVMLKEERHRRILELLERRQARRAELPELLGVSGHTIRRDLDELAGRAASGACTAGRSRARRSPPPTRRQVQAVEGKIAAARAAATLLEPGQVVILDGSSTALHLVDAIPPGHTGTFVTHSPPVAAALGPPAGLRSCTVGGTLDPRAMVAVGATRSRRSAGSAPTSASSGSGRCTPARGISTAYYEEAEVRRVLVGAPTASSASCRARSSAPCRVHYRASDGADPPRDRAGRAGRRAAAVRRSSACTSCARS